MLYLTIAGTFFVALGRFLLFLAALSSLSQYLS